jgi:myxalamid-type polyketide synthase MxaC
VDDFLERISKLSSNRLTLLAAELNSNLERLKRQASEPLAIIGMGCRFPGGANDPESFWRLLTEGREAISEVPPDRWDIDAFYDPNPDAPGKMSTRRGGFLSGIDQFDPEFFGISPREAAGMDPQQRLLLEVAWEALEHAGQSADLLEGTRTGVFAGLCNTDYYLMRSHSDPGSIDAYVATGNAHSVAAGRISYLLGLQGPSIAVDTACSSSLVAVHLACQSLRLGECSMALAGGVNLILSPDITVTLSKSHMMSPDGRCKAFDASADGFVRAEGCGLVVLKRLSDALADGNRILAVIRGTASNQDGKSSGLTAPNGPSQVAVIQQALANAGLNPSDVDFIEAHGTGTSLGDPIEARALADVFGPGRAADCALQIGAVKTNIGHAESAAGIAGLIKTVLALQYGRIPPSLHFKRLNPHIDWNGLAINVPAAEASWNRGKGFRVAGVSSFGFSGTNAHVVLSDLPAEELVLDPSGQEEDAGNPPLHLLPLSARTQPALAALVREYEQAFSKEPGLDLADVCHTAGAGRCHFEHRLAVVAPSVAEAKERLAAFQRGEKHASVQNGRSTNSAVPGIVFMFTGQGSQYVGMGRELFETQPVFRRELERCAEILEPLLEKPLLEVLFPDAGRGKRSVQLIDETQYTQPALFALEYALAALWRSWGVEPVAVLGHSVGEYVAACVAGVFSLEDALHLVAVRSRLMQTLPQNGTMAAVFAGEDRVRAAIAPYAGSVSIAAINSPQNTVISGKADDVLAALERLRQEGVEAKLLTVSHAFHSPLVEPILDEFEQYARSVQHQAPVIDLVLNTTGRLLDETSPPDAAYWRRHAREAVQFAESISTLRERGMRVFLEIGPAPVLTGLARQCVGDSDVLWLASLRKDRDGWSQMLSSLSSLFVLGFNPDWQSFNSLRLRRRIALPTYPFQRRRHWMDTRRIKSQTAGQHPLLGDGICSARGEWVFESKLSLEALPYLNDHRVHGIVVCPAPVYLEMAMACGRRAFAGQVCAQTDFAILEPLVLPEAGELTVQLIAAPCGDGALSFEIFSCEERTAGSRPVWTLHATGRLTPSGAAVTANLTPLDEVRKRLTEQISSAAYYEDLRALNIAFGPCFRGIREIWRRNGEALGRLEAPELVAAAANEYYVHPALLDACFQLLGAAILGGEDQAGADCYLMVGLERIVIARPPSAAAFWTHCVLRPSDDDSRGELLGDMQLVDDDGDVFGYVEGLRLKRATREALIHASRRHLEDWLYEVRWVPKNELGSNRGTQPLEYMPTSESLRAAAPQAATIKPGTWLLLSGSENAAEPWRAALEARGEQVQIATAAENSCDVESVSLAYRSLLHRTRAAGTPVKGVVHLVGTEGPPVSDDVEVSTLEASVRRSCISALSMFQALISENAAESSRIWLITRGGLPTAGSLSALDQSPMWGLGRTFAVEHPELWGGLVDIAEVSTQSVATAVDQLLGPAGEDQLAVVGQEVLAGRLMRCAKSIEAKPDRPIFKADASYLVTGGFGGMGRKVLDWMADQGARHIAVIGRSIDPANPDDAVAALGARSVQVLSMRADVADDAALGRVFEEIAARLPKLAGVIHVAGIFDDRVLARHDWPRFERVLKPKVAGGWNLHRRTKNLPLDFFVLFSSGASFLAPVGLGNYAAGNAFLDALAHHRRAQGLPAVSIDWGAWEKVGMAQAVGDRRQSQWSQGGGATMTPQQGLAVLQRLIRNAPPQVGVLIMDWPKYLKRFGSVAPPLYAELRRATDRANHAVGQELMATSAVRRFEDDQLAERRDLLFDHISKEAAEVLGFGRGNQLDAEQGLFDLGMDSLTAVELKNRLQTTLGKSLPSTLFFDYPNVQKLTEYLAREVFLWRDSAPAELDARTLVATPSVEEGEL